jgi:hypothetical protein
LLIVGRPYVNNERIAVPRLGRNLTACCPEHQSKKNASEISNAGANEQRHQANTKTLSSLCAASRRRRQRERGLSAVTQPCLVRAICARRPSRPNKVKSPSGGLTVTAGKRACQSTAHIVCPASRRRMHFRQRHPPSAVLCAAIRGTTYLAKF